MKKIADAGVFSVYVACCLASVILGMATVQTEACRQSLGVGLESCPVTSSDAILVCAEIVAKGGPSEPVVSPGFLWEVWGGCG